MTEREIEFARQLLASPNFEWTGGMVDEGGWRVSRAGPGFIQCQGTLAGVPRMQLGRGEFLPDIADDGTRGALEGLACRLWGAPLAQVSPMLDDGAYWVFYHNKPGVPEPRITGATKGEAWARAVLNAPTGGQS